MTSALALTEVGRALVRIGAPASVFDRADLVFDRVLKIKMSDRLLRDAGRIPAVSLRSLDAIHVATAEYAELAVSAFVTYDKRLAEIAASRGCRRSPLRNAPSQPGRTGPSVDGTRLSLSGLTTI